MDYALSLQRPHAVREYCVQYRETTLQFLMRIWTEEGIVFYFEHEADKHTLVLSDATSAMTDLQGSYIYNNNSDGSAHQPYIRSFSTQSKLSFGHATLKDYYFKQPSFDFLSHEFGYDKNLSNDYAYYDYPGRYKNISTGQEFTKTRIQYLQRDHNTGSGLGTYAVFSPGHLFEMQDDEALQRWLLIGVTHYGEYLAQILLR